MNISPDENIRVPLVDWNQGSKSTMLKNPLRTVIE